MGDCEAVTPEIQYLMEWLVGLPATSTVSNISCIFQCEKPVTEPGPSSRKPSYSHN
jgi:hypothetical protein